ncbi:hypothetical protein QWY22_14515 [Planococcus liqunii]|uniref:hypothetical protein n=1 Tax=Planococcus liqunii TaxID=3058394 RepID=UPI00260859BE|nr:hypothetical protein [Planococcus sp. N056]WKA50103.1 hypothetical protein QWY22_14515 [Planococcus sp. N056]
MKKTLLAASVLLLCASGYLIYLFGFKEYDIADAEVDSITKEEYVIELADGSKIVLDKHGNLMRHVEGSDEAIRMEKFRKELSHSETKEIAKTSSSNRKSSDAIEKYSNPNYKGKGKSTVNDIKSKYEPVIADIERQANASLNNLIEVAKNEYFEMEENDQSISYPYFYNKYSAAATELEKRTDQIFYAVIDMMRQELISNDHSISVSKSMEEEYKNRKEKIRRDILKKTAGL